MLFIPGTDVGSNVNDTQSEKIGLGIVVESPLSLFIFFITYHCGRYLDIQLFLCCTSELMETTKKW